MKKKPRARLENWSIEQSLVGFTVAVGTVYGDTRFRDGTEIRTSEVIKFDEYKLEAHTMNCIYQLGVHKDN